MDNDLVKRLRNAAQWADKGLVITPSVCLEAAYVIEELSKDWKKGKWLPDYDYAEYDFDGSTPLLEPRKYQDGWQCSLCGQYAPSEQNFCPNCGADMRGEDDV